jgi:hypothetical protein
MRHFLYNVPAFINVGAIFRHDLEAIGHDGAMAPKVLMWRKTHSNIRRNAKGVSHEDMGW